MQELAPIVLFSYNRLDTLKKTVDSLIKNDLSDRSNLFVYSDAAKYRKDIQKVNEVRVYLKTIKGFKNVEIILSDKNKGLANSIIQGVTEIINKYNKVIVLEDDLLLAPDFLKFMNMALDKYENQPMIYSVSGFMFDVNMKKDYAYDVFFTKRHCSWGWAMWKDRWNEIDWHVKDFSDFINSAAQRKAFDEIGSDLSESLIKQMNGQINSWAIRCNYHQFKKQTYTVYPLKTKLINIGFGQEATHTRQKFNRYKATLDNESKSTFNFPDQVFENKYLLKKFKNRYSKTTRLWFYILNKIWR